jgi:eukaryotic-like serine/threonine-protein kinase
VSSGAAQKQIPVDIKNKSAQDAQNELQLLGFQVKQQPQTSDKVDKGKVIDSNPPAGQSAAVNSVVVLLVSSGPAPVAIPDVSGLPADQAGAALQQQGFTTIVPANEPSDTMPVGSVTRTDPPAGQKVPTNTKITLFVSSGKATVPVPQEIGKAAADAIADLQRQGFSVGTTNRVDDANVGKVVDMNPEPGTQVPKNSPITLIIGIASSSGSTTSTT